MTTSRIGTRDLLSRFISTVERRAPESAPWSASLGALFLGGAMVYHVSVNGDPYVNATNTLVRYTGSVALSPLQTAILLLAGTGLLAFAGWTRITDRSLLLLIGTAVGEFVSIGYLLLLAIHTPAQTAYPLVHSYRATILGLVLFGIALISAHSPGTWREPRGLQRILTGAEPRRLFQWSVAGSILLVMAAGGVVFDLLPYWAYTAFEAFEVFGEHPVPATVVMLGWFGLAALPGYRQDGLLASWMLIAGPVGGAAITLNATDQSIIFQWEMLDSTVSTSWVFTTNVLGVAVIVGTVGYAIGVTTQQIRTRA
ncbi:hypothetical protein [Halosimplex pelagicum]|uniref:Uncharacterized protein n=1 Tax=Halosimplex pelagicum TaxID=869886 RepID=A0A7D5SV90_9EURY|nr:hypothetical protein [Halosimplex pelagicum]QLH82067.1 hypothetical protein HZS54_10785 [Halosimplex pelagicum]